MSSCKAATFLLLLFLAGQACAVRADPARTGPINPYPTSLNVAINDPLLTKKVNGTQPEQIHLQIASPTEVWVLWSSGDPFIGPIDTVTPGQAAADAAPTPVVSYSISAAGPFAVKSGTKKVHTSTFFYDPVNFVGAANYTSPVQNLVKIGGLKPATTYFYTVGDGTAENTSPVNSFTTLPAIGDLTAPLKIGIFGDLGDTYNSSMTLQHLAANSPQIILNVGDLSYADRHGPPVNASTDTLAKDKQYKNANVFNASPSVTDGRRWDGWGRLCQFIFSQVPHLATNGNHEIEEDGLGEQFQAYKTRYPPTGTAEEPLASGHVTTNTQNYYSVEYAGVHTTFLTPYIDHTPGSPQYNWFISDMESINRTNTPWVIIVEHFPLYSTRSGGDYKGNECMRQYMDPLIYTYGIDLWLSGHVHTYERSTPVVNYTANACGTTHILIGDGGNAGSVSDGYVDGDHNGTCPGADPTPPGIDPGANTTYNSNILNYPTLGYCNASATIPGLPWCASTQPAYSAYREPSFGHAILTIYNATTARFEWHRNQDSIPVVTDAVEITVDTTACPNKAFGGARLTVPPSPPPSPISPPPKPTKKPSKKPTHKPTRKPTKKPTRKPTKKLTHKKSTPRPFCYKHRVYEFRNHHYEKTSTHC